LLFLGNDTGTTNPEFPDDDDFERPEDTVWTAAASALAPELQSPGAARTGSYCPRLESFTCSGLSGYLVRWLVERRRAMGVPLKSVMIDQDDDVTDEEAKWLRANLEKYDTFENSDDDDLDTDDDMEMVIEIDDEEDMF
jgi:hypothetical protein